MIAEELIHELRNQVSDLHRRIDQLTARHPETGNERIIRQAITVPDEYGNYPAQEDCPNTYWIVFVDGNFPKTAGHQTHTLDYRQKLTEPKELAHCRWDGYEAYCPVYSLIGVEFHEGEGPTDEGQWWFDHINVYPCPSSSSSGPSSSGEASSSGEPSSSAGEVTIDVLICTPYNVCGDQIYFPQRRIHLPAGASIETIAGAWVPLSTCQTSSGGDWPPEYSSGVQSSGGPGDAPNPICVMGTLDPDVTGTYTFFDYFNGKPRYRGPGEGWANWLWWSYTISAWVIYDPASGSSWYWQKIADPSSPLGDYFPIGVATGVATVIEGACSSSGASSSAA